MHHLIKATHPEWHEILTTAFAAMDNDYLTSLAEQEDWLPGKKNLLATFTQPLSQVNYMLLGESPYPRAQSANGYAFWDNAVNSIWSEKGLSKEVNRATSLRNMIKMLLHARGDLTTSFSQEAIAALDKSLYCKTASQLFNSFIAQGFLLLNATLVFEPHKVNYHAKQWQPFMTSILMQLFKLKPTLKMVLFGRIAAQIPEAQVFDCLKAEHPYNLTFITNPDILNFFKPLDLLIYE